MSTSVQRSDVGAQMDTGTPRLTPCWRAGEPILRPASGSVRSWLGSIRGRRGRRGAQRRGRTGGRIGRGRPSGHHVWQRSSPLDEQRRDGLHETKVTASPAGYTMNYAHCFFVGRWLWNPTSTPHAGATQAAAAGVWDSHARLRPRAVQAHGHTNVLVNAHYLGSRWSGPRPMRSRCRSSCPSSWNRRWPPRCAARPGTGSGHRERGHSERCRPDVARRCGSEGGAAMALRPSRTRPISDRSRRMSRAESYALPRWCRRTMAARAPLHGRPRHESCGGGAHPGRGRELCRPHGLSGAVLTAESATRSTAARGSM